MSDETPRPEGGATTEKRGLRAWHLAVLSGLVGVLIGAVVMAVSSGYFVRRYLLANPEVLPEAMEVLQERETERKAEELAPTVNRHRAAIETPFHGGWAGARQPDVVLVEFFDYACGYCRASNAHIDRLLREDPGLRVVWREFPVLGPDSQQAAVASLAAARAGRYRDFYDALFSAGPPNAQTIAAARAAAGVGEPVLDEEVQRELGKNYELARALEVGGTPAFVVGDRVLHGAVGYERLREAIAEARAARTRS